MKLPSYGRRTLRYALGLALACGLTPAAAYALPTIPVNPLSALTEPSSTDAQDEQTAVPGQALVLYRASDTASVSLLDSAAADEFASAGVTIAQTWDFSAVDRAASRGDIELQSADGATDAIPSGDDLRVALVEREGADADELVAELAALDFVVAAQPNYVATIDAAAPDDTLYDGWQYGLTSESAGIDLEAALSARDEAAATDDNIVAVIDTGVDVSHPDLADHMWENLGIEGLPGEAGSNGYDFTGNDDDPTPGTTDVDSHGTHCAGVIAGIQNNAEGIAGASSDTKIMALKVAPENCRGVLYLKDVVSAYQYLIGAALSGQNVVAASNSWEIGSYAPVLDYLVNQAGKLGILSVFAAGNAGSDTATVSSGATTGLESPYAIVIASSNKSNALSTFSNFNETDVDLALPGSNIMSTVSTDAAHAYFSPSVSLAAGKDLEYVNDYSDYTPDSDAYRLFVYNADGTLASPEATDAFTIEPVADAGHGTPGLKVTFDPSRADGSSRYSATLQWYLDNPFIGTTHAVQDYAIGVSASIDAGSPSNTRLYLVPSLYAVKDGATVPLHGVSTITEVNIDLTNVYGTSLAALDTEADRLIGAVQFDIMPVDDVWSSEKTTFYIEPYGIGLVDGEGVDDETSDYAPYGEMSGTSMATPLAAGTVGQLAALDPEASALELRGKLVGSTVPVSTTTYGDVEKHTATDGRFDWNVALDDDAVNANTWSVDADPATGTVTVHGYALGDASVILDGEGVSCTAQADSELTFTAPADAFDGGAHRIDVTDGSTGRTHRASYSLPAREASYDVMRTDSLPGGATDSATGSLVGTEGALYFADTKGAYLYRLDHPGNSSWTACAAPGAPWQSTMHESHAPIAYTAIGSDIVAVTTDLDESGTVVLAATYSAERDEWSTYRQIDAIATPEEADQALYISSLVDATTIGGTTYALVRAYYQFATGDYFLRYAIATLEGPDGELSATEIQTEQFPGIMLAPVAPIVHDGKIYVLGAVGGGRTDPSATHAPHAYTVELASGTLSDLGAIDNAPVFTYSDYGDLEGCVTVPFEDGALVFARSQQGVGDTMYIDLDTLRCEGSAWLGSDSATGVTITSATVFDGTVHLTALDNGTDAASATGALYTLPRVAAEQLASIACPTERYTDLDELAWYHEPVDWAVSEKIMLGVDADAGVFDPTGTLTRAQMAQVLYNMAGKPAVDDPIPYSDCDQNAWYRDAVAWCTQQGIFMGYDDTDKFGPDDPLTREQMATILWRIAAPETAPEGDLARFTDGATVSDWATEAVTWAVAEGYLRGIGNTTELQPRGDLERAQAATVFMRADRDGFPFPQPAA
ncbi:MAG TPA: S8 family serine peptidase [Collinsella ihuae]|uniref:S8 family serine peptidase n=1 Tax=Collinsella ihumii TaxID=1720204 RepID=A0A921IRS1_9ACTN|nr:S8 family serine peptidase [Collinsella ihumii]